MLSIGYTVYMYSIYRLKPTDVPPFVPPQPVRLLDQLRRHMREAGYAWKTEKTYIEWIRRFIYFHGKQHPKALAELHVEQYLSYLAVDRNCSPARAKRRPICSLSPPPIADFAAPLTPRLRAWRGSISSNSRGRAKRSNSSRWGPRALSF